LHLKWRVTGSLPLVILGNILDQSLTLCVGNYRGLWRLGLIIVLIKKALIVTPQESSRIDALTLARRFI
jgi:hypothetical protein